MAELETSHVFNGDMERVFRAIGNYGEYAKYLQGVTGIVVSPAPKGSNSKCLVRYELNIIKTFHYTLEMFEEPSTKVWWRMVDSNLMKQNEGSWTFSPDGPGKTKAIYNLDVKFKGLVPSMITDQVAKANLPQMFAGFQKLIDQTSP